MAEQADAATKAGATGCVIAFVIVACLGAYACYSDEAIQRADFDQASAIRTTAPEIGAAWASNEVAAKAAFDGKSIIIGGTVAKISGAGDSHPSVDLDGPGPTSPVSLIVHSAADAIPLQPGDAATFNCVGARTSLGSVVLDSCALAKRERRPLE